MELRSDWLAAPADDELRRSFAEPDLDDHDWAPIEVPGHWRSNPAFADHDGPLLHRTRFEQTSGPAGRRWWLRFDGIFYEGDVWLDGGYVGDTEGYFFSHEFEVTDAIGSRSEHVLAVETACGRPRRGAGERALTGWFSGPDVDAEWNPGGIWRPVHLEHSGRVRIRHLVTRCVAATPERAVLELTAQLDAAEPTDAHIRTTIGGVDHGTDRPLATGENEVEWTVTVDQPTLWWPHGLGDPGVEPVTVEVRLRDAAGSHVSDRRRFRTGLRHIELRRWILHVNGERLFCKGTTLAPTRQALGSATADELRADVEAARAAGLDLLRVRAHVSRPETYEAADAAGMLIWQDFPAQGVLARSVREQARQQARRLVATLAHHPSVALWCAHDDPLPPDGDNRPAGGLGAALRQQLPSWNRSLLDRTVARALDAADGTRPVVRHAGVVPNGPLFQHTATHLFPGWRWGEVRDLAGLARALPSQVRFVAAIGAQSVPDTDDFVSARDWPDLDWDRLGRRHGAEVGSLLTTTPIDDHTYESWRAATQLHQAEVVRRSIEQLRRLKYRPTGGVIQNGLADAHPSISWGVLDHQRKPKPAHDALEAACRPVIVVADLLPAVVAPGASLALDIHVVSDRRLDLTGWVRAELFWHHPNDPAGGGAHRWAFEGDVPADSCVLVGTIQFEAPTAPGATLTLTLTGQVGDEQPENRYVARVG